MEKTEEISLMVIWWTILKTTFYGIPPSRNAKDFFEALGNKFKKLDEAETHNL